MITIDGSMGEGGGQVLRTSLGFDKRFGAGWTFSLEGIFTKNMVEVDWQNLLFDPTKIPW